MPDSPFLPPRRGLVLIESSTVASYQALAGICELDGFSTIWLAAAPLHFIRGAAAAIWDGDDLTETLRVRQFRAWRRNLDDMPVIVLTHFVRTSDVETAQECGVTHVLSKPFAADDLSLALSDAVAVKPLGATFSKAA